MVRLILFDCDGTLVDSQHVIVETMNRASRSHGQPPPSAENIRRIVGLTLEPAIAVLAPALRDEDHLTLAELYRQHFVALRQAGDVDEPMFDGAREVLDALSARGILLGVATGKGMRGLKFVLEHHGLTNRFITLQTADSHPSKPHPSMVKQALRETGAAAEETWLIGDTSFDMQMASAAGVRPVGVAWGYHPVSALEAAGASVVLDRFEQILDLVADEQA
jgi:phosphoglycolate phosphatase